MKEEKDRSNLKVITDTNLFISFLTNGDFRFIYELINIEKIDLLLSKELIDELTRVSFRPKFTKLIQKSQIYILNEILLKFGIMVNVTSNINISRDKNDDYLLALAKDGNADFLLTGDKDLLSIGKFENTHIIKISEFKQLMKNI